MISEYQNAVQLAGILEIPFIAVTSISKILEVKYKDKLKRNGYTDDEIKMLVQEWGNKFFTNHKYLWPVFMASLICSFPVLLVMMFRVSVLKHSAINLTKIKVQVVNFCILFVLFMIFT